MHGLFDVIFRYFVYEYLFFTCTYVYTVETGIFLYRVILALKIFVLCKYF